jgi:hypothetical protein
MGCLYCRVSRMEARTGNSPTPEDAPTPCLDPPHLKRLHIEETALTPNPLFSPTRAPQQEDPDSPIWGVGPSYSKNSGVTSMGPSFETVSGGSVNDELALLTQYDSSPAIQTPASVMVATSPTAASVLETTPQATGAGFTAVGADLTFRCLTSEAFADESSCVEGSAVIPKPLPHVDVIIASADPEPVGAGTPCTDESDATTPACADVTITENGPNPLADELSCREEPDATLTSQSCADDTVTENGPPSPVGIPVVQSADADVANGSDMAVSSAGAVLPCSPVSLEPSAASSMTDSPADIPTASPASPAETCNPTDPDYPQTDNMPPAVLRTVAQSAGADALNGNDTGESSEGAVLPCSPVSLEPSAASSMTDSPADIPAVSLTSPAETSDPSDAVDPQTDEWPAAVLSHMVQPAGPDVLNRHDNAPPDVEVMPSRIPRPLPLATRPHLTLIPRPGVTTQGQADLRGSSCDSPAEESPRFSAFRINPPEARKGVQCPLPGNVLGAGTPEPIRPSLPTLAASDEPVVETPTWDRSLSVIVEPGSPWDELCDSPSPQLPRRFFPRESLRETWGAHGLGSLLAGGRAPSDLLEPGTEWAASPKDQEQVHNSERTLFGI